MLRTFFVGNCELFYRKSQKVLGSLVVKQLVKINCFFLVFCAPIFVLGYFQAHWGVSFRMANALIKAHKRFDFKLLPGQRHGFGNMTEYAFWLRADHFSKHLLGVTATEVNLLQMNRDVPQNK